MSEKEITDAMATERSLKNDGGPAFPETPLSGGHPGMSLRDYFAGMSLQGLRSSGSLVDSERAARLSYEDADAMLRERAR